LGRGLAGRESWVDHDMLGLQLWRRRFEQKVPSGSGSSCYRTQQQKSSQKYCRRPKVEPTPTPDPGRILQAVSVASYREGFMAGSKGSSI
jgi:hypothetical protein